MMSFLVRSVLILVAVLAGCGDGGAARTAGASEESLDVLLDRVGSEDDGAVDDVLDWVAATDEDVLEVVQPWLADERWSVRVAGVRAIDDYSEDPARTAALIARTSDIDWRVRAAAFRALQRTIPAMPVPNRDALIADRERDLLKHLGVGDIALLGEPLPDALCEIHAFTQRKAFAGPFIDSCLGCHGPEDRRSPAVTGDRCASCHPGEVDTFAASAHAQSLSHLRLLTVDQAARTLVPVDFGPMQGLTCASCHEQSPAHASSCDMDFGPAGASSCTVCHASTDREWMAWIQQPPLRLESWPVRTLREGVHQTPPEDCISCHAPVVPDGIVHHGFTARRDIELLRSGLFVDTTRDEEGVTILLTNLAGHDYPTGTRRRGLRVWIDAGHGEILHAVLSPRRAGSIESAHQPSLAPHETRRLRIEVAELDRNVRVRVEYVRDRANPDRYRVDLIDREIPPQQTVSPQQDSPFNSLGKSASRRGLATGVSD